MSRKIITQPLPQDIRNWSFRGMECVGWDFSGRDIRGCDFRNAKLNGANFSWAIAGRSEKQIIRDILVGLTVTLVFAFATKVAVTETFIKPIPLMSGFIISLMSMRSAFFEGAIASLFMFLGMSILAALAAIDFSARGETLNGVLFGLFSITLMLSTIYSIYNVIQTFKSSIGTTFKDANITHVNFSHAILDNCSFVRAKTNYINWSHIRGTESTIDFTEVQMQLMINRNGDGGKYQYQFLSNLYLVSTELVKANLSGAYLAQSNLSCAKLIYANLSGSDLTGSNFQYADLSYANLVSSKAIGADFRHATLTGACIQNWAINNGTQFNNIIADYIYLTPDQNKQNRRPLSGSFEPGDFEALITHFANTLDFIRRRGTDPTAFNHTLKQFQQDYPEAHIKTVVNLDADRVLVQATVPEGSDKVKIYEEFNHKLQLKEQEIRYLKGTIEDKDKTIDRNDRIIDELIKRPQPTIQLLQANNPTGTIMPNIQAGGDINIAKGKSAINTGTGAAAAGNISGTLNLNLNALRETEDPKAKELVDLIEQLRKAIEALDSDLDDRYKKRAIEYLNTLTELAKDKPEDILKRAKENLDDLADIADKGSKLATFAEKHLPTFMMAIGALRLWFGV
jgi:uncharacterized protein YjbI with pentapeptide repeats